MYTEQVHGGGLSGTNPRVWTLQVQPQSHWNSVVDPEENLFFFFFLS